MGSKYPATFTGDIGAPLTIGGLTASTSKRGRLFFFAFGVGGAPGDQTIQWILQRYTAAGTSTAVVPAELDPGEPAALLASGENHSAEPTYTSAKELFQLSVNQRMPFAMHCRPGAEFVLPAVAANGVGMKANHASVTNNADVTFHWEE